MVSPGQRQRAILNVSARLGFDGQIADFEAVFYTFKTVST
jgi:hypothetical protein